MILFAVTAGIFLTGITVLGSVAWVLGWIERRQASKINISPDPYWKTWWSKNEGAIYKIGTVLIWVILMRWMEWQALCKLTGIGFLANIGFLMRIGERGWRIVGASFFLAPITGALICFTLFLIGGSCKINGIDSRFHRHVRLFLESNQLPPQA